ncbi:MAG: DUF3108 domain-containing protein [Idiomarina sp.]|nr:DUF3108 domain-containing protein [Idiomarina sp.]
MALLLTSGSLPVWASVAVDDRAEAIKKAESMTRAYVAEYDLNRRGRNHGNAGRELTRTDRDTWRYQTFTRASVLFLSDRRYNDTEFRLREGRVEPLMFEYTREGTGSNRHFYVEFDWDAQTLVPRNGDRLDAEWRDHLVDANSVLHQLQIDVAAGGEEWTYELIDDDGENAEFSFRFDGEETIRVPFGTMDAIRVVRVRDHDRRQTLFWFSPMHNYTLVKMQQIEGGREQAQVVLRSLKFTD